MFINISQDKYSDWSEKKVQSARGYGEVLNFKYPNITWDLTTDEIEESADRFYDKIVKLNYQATVHITGDATFLFALATKLLNAGIPCITTVSNENTNEFIRFRYIKHL